MGHYGRGLGKSNKGGEYDGFLLWPTVETSAAACSILERFASDSHECKFAQIIAIV